MHYFGVPNFWKKFRDECTQSTPLDPKQCLGLFRSISQSFGMKNYAKLVFWPCYFGVSNSQKMFRYERTQSTPFDPKRCFRVFRNIWQPFDTKNDANFMFRAFVHYFGVPNFWKKFRYERTQSTPLDPKRSLGVFQSILQTFDMKNYAKFVFGLECTISGYRTPTKTFAMNAPNLLH